MKTTKFFNEIVFRNRFNNNRPQALRPGAKLNFSSRGRFGTPSSSTPAPVPLDADPSGSADIPVEQKKEDSEHTVSQVRKHEQIKIAF